MPSSSASALDFLCSALAIRTDFLRDIIGVTILLLGDSVVVLRQILPKSRLVLPSLEYLSVFVLGVCGVATSLVLTA